MFWESSGIHSGEAGIPLGRLTPILQHSDKASALKTSFKDLVLVHTIIKLLKKTSHG